MSNICILGNIVKRIDEDVDLVLECNREKLMMDVTGLSKEVI